MAFAGLRAFDKNFCSLMSNQSINSIMDYPGAMLKSFKRAARDRVMSSPEMMKKNPSFAPRPSTNGDVFGYGDALKSMFYKSNTGELSAARVGAAGAAGLATTGIAGSYILGD